MNDTLKTTFAIIGFILFLDVMGYMFWALSGQHPTDGFFIGSITQHVIALF